MKILKKLCAFLGAAAIAVSAASVSVSAENSEKVVDDADILSYSEELALSSKISEVIEKYDYKYDIVIVTTGSKGNKTIEAFADDYYDYNDYGYDSEGSGIIFAVDMGERWWHIGTTGRAINAFTDYGLEKIDDIVIGYLRDGEYYRGFYRFVELADDYMDQYESTGRPYDTNNAHSSDHLAKEEIRRNALISVIVGLVVAFAVCMGQKAKLKSARMQTDAQQYIRRGSFRVTNMSDQFLYRNVSKTRIERNSGGHSGGSSTHRSSSGRSHGGRSGRF